MEALNISSFPSSSPSFFLRIRSLMASFVFLCLIILCFLERGLALPVTDIKTHLLPHTHTLLLSSLQPAATCSPSSSTTQAGNNKASVLKLVHKHGPCSQLHKSKTGHGVTNRNVYQYKIYKQDQDRVDSIHSRLNSANNAPPLAQSEVATTIPAKSGVVIGSSSYIVTVVLGTPAKELSLVFDTGSDLTWIQCQPCSGTCYQQKEPIFDPSLSSSYANISCNAASCSQLTNAGLKRDCSASTCLYGVQYGDRSFSIGFLANDKLGVGSIDVFDNFLFGCGQDNEGLFSGAAGLLGLGRDKLSIVEQTAQKYNRVFSYCLPSTSSSTGYLSFGNGGSGNDIKFTPITQLSNGESFYSLGLTGIKVNDNQLSIPDSIFSNSGTIIDSGTVITRLPATAYAALRGAFQDAMKSYKLTEPYSLFDTCYDSNGSDNVTFPGVGFVFGDVMVDLDAAGIVVSVSASQFCLAFAGNKDDSGVGIIGSVQQKRMEVVYDAAGGKVGFKPAGCE